MEGGHKTSETFPNMKWKVDVFCVALCLVNASLLAYLCIETCMYHIYVNIIVSNGLR